MSGYNPMVQGKHTHTITKKKWPDLPDEDSDFTPDLGRKIISKYQEALEAKDKEIELVHDRIAALEEWRDAQLLVAADELDPAEPRFSKTVDMAAKAAGVTYEQAETVIKAIREPSEGMLNASGCECEGMYGTEYIRSDWQAMIDAVLGESDE